MNKVNQEEEFNDLCKELKYQAMKIIDESIARFKDKDHYFIPISDETLSIINEYGLSILNKTHNETWIETRPEGKVLRTCSLGKNKTNECRSCIYMNKLFRLRLNYGTF